VNGPHRAVTVEFLGLPGVGKTTVSRRTAEELSRRGVVVSERVLALSDRSRMGPRLRGYSGKLRLIARELLVHPVAAFRSLRAINATGQRSPSVLLMVAANWLMQCSLLRSCRRATAVHLFEEGIFQALWSIGLECRPGAVRSVGATLTAALSMPDVVVVLEADPEHVLHRLETRQGCESRADRWSRNDVHAVTHASALMLEVIETLTWIGRHTARPRVIFGRNESEGDPEVVARDLARNIEQLWLAGQCDDRSPAAPLEPAGDRS